VGEGGDARAVDDRRQQLPLARVARCGDRAAGEHRACQQGLDHQAAAQLLEDHRDVEAGAAEAALGFAVQRRDHAQLGKLSPCLRAVALRRLRDAVARIEGVLLPDEAAQRVRQHAPVFGGCEVHG
jgi:hypothetical protein